MIRKTKLTFNAKVFDEQNYPDTLAPIYSHGSTCCSICFMSAQNYHSAKEIKEAVNHIITDSNSRTFSPAERNYGEKNILVITTPTEAQLEKNLKIVGFECIKSGLKRRKGYSPGTLKMWLYSF